MRRSEAHALLGACHSVYLLRRRTDKVDTFFGAMSSISRCDRCVYVREFQIYLGRGFSGDAWAAPGRSVLVLGPSRSGKTSSLIVPNLLMSATAAVTTSTKPDILQSVASARRDVPQLLYDPSGTVACPAGVTGIGFSILDAARTWDGALLIARSLTETSRQLRGGRAEDHWDERAGALVATMAHASALAGHSLHRFALHIEKRAADENFEILRSHYGDSHHSVAMMSGLLETEEREQSGIWSSSSGLVAGLRTDAARDAARRPRIMADEALSMGAQIHIVAPSRYQSLSAPLVVGLIESLVHTAYDDPHDRHQLLLALDELANVAPLPGLAGIVSEGGGQGVLTLACLQDLSQARQRWPVSGDAFLSLFPNTVVLPGIADRTTLELVADLAGRRREKTPSWNTSARGRLQNVGWSHPDTPRMDMSHVARGRSGYALAVSEANAVHWIGLTPAYRDARFRPYLDRELTSRSRER